MGVEKGEIPTKWVGCSNQECKGHVTILVLATEDESKVLCSECRMKTAAEKRGGFRFGS